MGRKKNSALSSLRDANVEEHLALCTAFQFRLRTIKTIFTTTLKIREACLIQINLRLV